VVIWLQQKQHRHRSTRRILSTSCELHSAAGADEHALQELLANNSATLATLNWMITGVWLKL
jgi:hypothetical protein